MLWHDNENYYLRTRMVFCSYLLNIHLIVLTLVEQPWKCRMRIYIFFFSSISRRRKNLLMAGNLLNSSHESLILPIIHFNLSILESDFAFLFAFICRVLGDNLFCLACNVNVVDEDVDMSFS